MKLELLVLLNGLRPISKETHNFWETIDREIASKNGDWLKAYHLLCYEWRHDDSILLDLTYYLAKNYSYPIPKALFFPAMPYWNGRHIENNKKKYYETRKIGGLAIEEFTIEDLANKWLRDYLSGESFYKRNKFFFTKSEDDIFFKYNFEFQDDKSFTRLIKQYISSKIYPVRNLGLINSLSVKFKNYFTNPFITKFLSFIRDNGNVPKKNIPEICDYLLSIVYDDDQNNFSFSGRTWPGLKRLSDEWHQRIAYPPEQIEKYIKSKWKKLEGVQDFKAELNNKKWEIKQITNGLWLYEEGEFMHHCCFQYIEKCINGECAIFALRCYDENGINIKKSATIEISSEKYLLQASGQHNNVLDDETRDIIEEWRDINGIVDTDDEDSMWADEEYWEEVKKYNDDYELILGDESEYNNEIYSSYDDYDENEE